MERKFPDFKLNGEKCQANFCSSRAFNYCVKHKEWLCSSCVMIFHYDCECKISKNKECIEASFKIISNLIQKLEKDGDDFNLERQCDGYNDFVTEIRGDYEKWNKRYTEDPNNLFNKNIYLNCCKKLFNDIFESQAYKLWADFTCRLKILSDTRIGHEANHHRQQFVYSKKREMKQREKEIVSEEEEMKENFIESQEESKEFILNNCEQGENDSFLDQIRIYNLEELFKNLQEKFQKEIKKVVAENKENIEGMQN